MTNLLLYAATVLIWGSTWLAIKYQLGVVAPEVSVAWRFLIAAALLIGFCRATGRPMRYGWRAHALIALQGVLLFCVNYLLFYYATETVTSGLNAVVFSTVVIMNIAGTAVLFGTRVAPRVAAAAALGLVGIALVFRPEIAAADLAGGGVRGLLLGLAATLSASLGMLTSAYNQRRGLPVVQTNAFGMAYGGLIMALVAALLGRSFTLDPSPLYLGSLIYLAVVGSAIAFGCYLTLLGRIGAERAAYATVLFPVIALALSTVVEDYRWTGEALAGVALVLLGNLLVLAPRSRPAPNRAPERSGAD
jgi:drug/metabolite transporter (DMT)-like permease